MTVSRGDIHEYLGTTIGYSVLGKVKFYTMDYSDKMLLELLPGFDGESATPAASHLFSVNPEAEKID
eukprot:746929-Ditylum_brightwellii.AAC.1